MIPEGERDGIWPHRPHYGMTGMGHGGWGATVDKREIMRRHYAATLMELCETRALRDITVGDLVEAAGTARQTFYNHFADINDLICYTGSLPMMASRGPFTDVDATRRVYEGALRHRAFFRQLPAQSGQNNFRMATLAWLLDTYRERFVTPDLPEGERAFREACLTMYCNGSVAAFMEWCASDMAAPIDALVRAVYEMSPQFVKDELARMPERLDDYPR